MRKLFSAPPSGSTAEQEKGLARLPMPYHESNRIARVVSAVYTTPRDSSA